MANFRRPEINMAAVRAGDSEAVMVAVAACAARWFIASGFHIAANVTPAHAIALESSKGGLLIAALELRELLGKTPDGRKALRDFGFEPVLQDVEGE